MSFDIEHHVEVALQGLMVGQRSHVEALYADPASIARGILGTVEATFKPHLPGIGAQVGAEADIA